MRPLSAPRHEARPAAGAQAFGASLRHHRIRRIVSGIADRAYARSSMWKRTTSRTGYPHRAINQESMGAPRKGAGARLPEPVVHGDGAGILRGLSAPVNRITMGV